MGNYSIADLITPCYVFDEQEFERGIHEFGEALRQVFTRVAIGYSVKTNSLPYALAKARALGCMAEVVSHDEYMLACMCGFTPDEIIYNGPMKSQLTFLEAVTARAVVNIETKRELKWLDMLPKDDIHDVGLRLNINISHISPEDAEGDDDNSRFGFSDESTELKDALDFISERPWVRLAGLHIHRTAHSRSPRFYEKSVAYAITVMKKYGLSLKYIDVGGGYFGIFPNKPTFADYANAFHKPLKANGMERLKVIVEPGNALTASSFKFLTEVIDVKTVDSRTRFVTTDGSRIDVDPFFRKSSYLNEIVRNAEGRPIEPVQVVTGCTCLEYDRLFTLLNEPRLEVGDRIAYNNVGAYTMTLTPQFIRLWPRVYAVTDSGAIVMAREAASASDIMAMNQINNPEHKRTESI